MEIISAKGILNIWAVCKGHTITRGAKRPIKTYVCLTVKSFSAFWDHNSFYLLGKSDTASPEARDEHISGRLFNPKMDLLCAVWYKPTDRATRISLYGYLRTVNENSRIKVLTCIGCWFKYRCYKEICGSLGSHIYICLAFRPHIFSVRNSLICDCGHRRCTSQ